MSDAFDPYYEWLGIPPREQPVNYYRLLALNLYETNSQVIANAADRQMTYIRTFQSGAHSKESQIILNEIARARVTLLNEASKNKYDNDLKCQAFRGELQSDVSPFPDKPSTFPFNDFVPVSDKPSASPFNDSVPVSDKPSTFPFNVFAPVSDAPSASPFNDFAPVSDAPQTSSFNVFTPVPDAPSASPFNDFAPVSDAPSASSFNVFAPVSDSPSASPFNDFAPAPDAPQTSSFNVFAPVSDAPSTSPFNNFTPVPDTPQASPFNDLTPAPDAPQASPLNIFAPAPDAPQASPLNNFEPVPDAPQTFPLNDFALVPQKAAGPSNSTVKKSGAVSDAKRLHRKKGKQRNGETKNAKRNLILMASAIGSCFLVLLTILILVISFFRSSSTPTEPSIHEGERMVKTVNGVEFAFCWCPPRTFTMGSPETETGREPYWGGKETQHRVTLTKGFWMQETEVTQAQWKAVMENNPSEFRGNVLPVENVSWDDCQEFCRKCTELGLPVQLPTEAQWEYACRAGSSSRYSFGDSDNLLFTYCNYCDKSNTSERNYQDKDHDDGYDNTAPVKSFQPNAWGLYDMHGNVYEWCNDWHESNIASRSVKDPKGPESGSNRVVRGGSWLGDFRSCRSALRLKNPPEYRYNDLGFRLSLGQ